MDNEMMWLMVISITAFFLAGWCLISVIEEIIEEISHRYHVSQYLRRKGKYGRINN